MYAPHSPRKPLAQDPDYALVRACQADPQGSFQELYERYRKRVERQCYRITGNQVDAMDAAQETFLLLFEKIHTFKFEARFSSWVFVIARNASIGWKRKSRSGRREQSLESNVWSMPEESAPGAGPLQITGQKDVQRLVRVALDELPPSHRKVAKLRHTRGRTYGQIAAAMHLPEGTVKSRLNRARKLLQKRFEDSGLALVG